MTQNLLPGTQIEVVNERKLGTFKHGLFDFDGTVSLMREGWQKIMLPVMMKAIAGDTEPTPEIEEASRDYIEESTGINTILQMEHLVTMVRDAGHVPEDQVLDAYGYKEVYNDALMDSVNQRIAAVKAGELSLEEVTVRGSVEFVRRCHAKGLSMFIFSGTDHDDVVNESTLCTVAQYFEEIRGALRTYAESNKEQIIKDLIAKHDLHGEEVLVCGDGPVEIRHGSEHGCVTVAVCSDEVRGEGWDMEKRARLMKAGADILVPDFGEVDALMDYLFPGN
jgi:phosphoglycolate phosphatase-like HAD superfamily hydrolase